MSETRLILGSEDLTKVRLLGCAEPLGEMMVSAHILSMRSADHADPVLGGWARRTVTALGPTAAVMLGVMNSAVIQLCDFLLPRPYTAAAFEDSLEMIRCTSATGWQLELEHLVGDGL